MNELALFAGAGGGILGGKLLGWNTVCAVEIEKYPREVLLQRQRDGILSPFPIWDDICTFDGRPWKGAVDIISGGFPCQDISAAGKGIGITGSRSGLWKEMSRVVCEVRPRFVFVENSPMLTSRGLDTVLGDLSGMGYDARWCVLGADDAGAPHRRKRIWILAYTESREPWESPEWKGWENISRRSKEVANVAYTNDHGLQGADVRKAEHRAENGLFTERSKTVCNAMYTGLSQTWAEQQTTRIAGTDSSITWWDTDPADLPDTGQEYDERYSSGIQEGQAERTDGTIYNQSGNQGQGRTGTIEPFMGRVAHGVAHRVDRLKAIGNGQVPAVAAIAFIILSEGLI